jgi:hypothetical protein
VFRLLRGLLGQNFDILKLTLVSVFFASSAYSDTDQPSREVLLLAKMHQSAADSCEATDLSDPDLNSICLINFNILWQLRVAGWCQTPYNEADISDFGFTSCANYERLFVSAKPDSFPFRAEISDQKAFIEIPLFGVDRSVSPTLTNLWAQVEIASILIGCSKDIGTMSVLLSSYPLPVFSGAVYAQIDDANFNVDYKSLEQGVNPHRFALRDGEAVLRLVDYLRPPDFKKLSKTGYATRQISLSDEAGRMANFDFGLNTISPLQIEQYNSVLNAVLDKCAWSAQR